MRTWRVTPVPLRCGLCGATIPKDSAYEEIQFYNAIKHPKRRCSGCAETPRPLEIADEPARFPPVRLKSWAEVTGERDYKMAQAEPELTRGPRPDDGASR